MAPVPGRTLVGRDRQLTTEGSDDIYGRVGSLLEVGTGFHPELTGRENIYRNGAIFRMTALEETPAWLR
jgi:ABC-type polysaccharide/polyol phosphate transport system ATPase subunit